jgi:hypothetical protein
MMLKTTKLRLREYVGVTFFRCISLFLFYDLTCAIIYRKVQLPLPLFHRWATVDQNPHLFFLSLGLLLLYLAVVGVVLNWMIKGLKAEHNYFRRLDAQLPLDEAIREDFDPRSVRKD